MIELDAGPELDALITQEIFGMDVLGIVHCERDYDGRWFTAPCDPGCGWARLRPLYIRGNQCSCDLIGADDEYPPAKRLGHYWTCLEAAPLYSAHILWAWEVVEKLRELEISLIIQDEWCVGWTVTMFDVQHNHRIIGIGAEKTVPLSICIAALDAIRVIRKRKAE